MKLFSYKNTSTKNKNYSERLWVILVIREFYETGVVLLIETKLSMGGFRSEVYLIFWEKSVEETWVKLSVWTDYELK